MKFEDVLDQMLAIHKTKDADYSGGNESFSNFKESERIGVNDWKGAFIRLQDKYSRCCNLIKKKEAHAVKTETLDDTLIDLANYAIIVYILKKRAEKQIPSGVTGDFQPFINYNKD